MDTFSDFLAAWREGTLEDDATWRSWQFSTAKPAFAKDALKKLSLVYAGELGVRQFMALYEIRSTAEAEAILSQWYLWHRKSKGYSTPYVARRRAPKPPQVQS